MFRESLSLFSQYLLLRRWNVVINNCQNVSPKLGNIISRKSSSGVENIRDELGLDCTQKMSNAMKAYLQRAKEYDEFMKREKEEYLLGKRHLANMMGENPDSFTQDDVNKSIEYLFPSGLYVKAARPIMDEPEKIFPPKKAAQFDALGRPFHSMFYTLKPNFYSALHETINHLQNLDKHMLDQMSQGLIPKETDTFKSAESNWKSSAELEKIFLEPISEKNYNNFISALQKLASHSYSSNAGNFIMQYRNIKQVMKDTLVIPPLQYDSTGRPFVIVKHCQKFITTGTVKLLGNGSGKITIDNQDITFFEHRQYREQVIFPLIFTGMENSIDVEVTFDNEGGESGYAALIRWGIAWGLRSFVDKRMIEKMRLAGLLTRDFRRRERKKPGQEGKRRKFTWNKR